MPPLITFGRGWHAYCYEIHQRKKLGTTDYTDGTDMGNLIHEKLSEEIIGAAMTVLNELKPGLDEKLYEKRVVK
ncbi:MAG: hypothetical protein HYV36_07400 [Lentisphaerae bacterium]|nr:hypothetical protein [Lentisphaerota bacterium]